MTLPGGATLTGPTSRRPDKAKPPSGDGVTVTEQPLTASGRQNRPLVDI